MAPVTAPRLALVTGASGGVGSAVTKMLVAEGYTVLALGRRMEALRALQEQDPAHILPLAMDVCSQQSLWITTLIECFSYYDLPARLDVLVCAHGHPPVTTATTSLSLAQEFIPVLMTDVGGAFLAAQTVAPYMQRQQHGSIIFIASLHAHQTYPARAPYAAAKAGVAAMARSLALEWGRDGITVNTIVPWQIAGERTFRLAHQQEQATGTDLLAQYLRRSPQRQLVPEHDVAAAVRFLIQTRSCHGMELCLDTGVSASMWPEDF